jgi:TonB family protein
VKDPVGEELERRWAEPWPWRSALAGALAFHFAVAALLTVAPGRHSRTLRLPSVQVRMVAPLPAPPGRTQAGPAAQPARAAAPAPQKRPPAAKQPSRPPAPPARAAVAASKAPQPAPARSVPTGESAASGPPAATTIGPPGAGSDELRSPSGAIGLGSGSGAVEEPFPFTYYLNRFVSVVESNWFRPPAPAETRCRVRCRIDRSGRLLEAGIEDESVVPAFDRAALRAIYASAPFPPLPQDFAGQSLTLHLDFGPE